MIKKTLVFLIFLSIFGIFSLSALGSIRTDLRSEVTFRFFKRPGHA